MCIMHERIIKIIAFLGVISVLCNSCIDSRLIYVKNGVCISGERPFPKSLTFIPLKWTSASHIYDSIYIDYQRPFDANLKNIYICLFGREINLASFSYNEIAQMDMGKSWVKNIVCCSNWKNENTYTIEMTYTEKGRMHSRMLIHFDKSQKISSLYMHCEKADLIQLKMKRNHHTTIFPFPIYESEVLEIFGKDGIIQVPCTW